MPIVNHSAFAQVFPLVPCRASEFAQQANLLEHLERTPRLDANGQLLAVLCAQAPSTLL